MFFGDVSYQKQFDTEFVYTCSYVLLNPCGVFSVCCDCIHRPDFVGTVLFMFDPYGVSFGFTLTIRLEPPER